VTEAISAKLSEREARLIRSCAAANRSSDLRRIEREWEAMAESETLGEPWTNDPPR
jgi:hypothetical protein